MTHITKVKVVMITIITKINQNERKKEATTKIMATAQAPK